MKYKNNKRGQAWGFDLMMATSLFLVGIIAFYTYSLNYPTETKETFESLEYDANIIAESLLSEGYPADWNPTNVEVIGILTNNTIDNQKLNEFFYLASTPDGYKKTKALFNTIYDYSINFSVKFPDIDYIGTDLRTVNPNNLIKTTRFTFSNNPIVMNIYVYN